MSAQQLRIQQGPKPSLLNPGPGLSAPTQLHRKTEERLSPPQVVLVAVEHTEAPSLQTRGQHLSCRHGGDSDGNGGSEEETRVRKGFQEGTRQTGFLTCSKHHGCKPEAPTYTTERKLSAVSILFKLPINMTFKELDTTKLLIHTHTHTTFKNPLTKYLSWVNNSSTDIITVLSLLQIKPRQDSEGYLKVLFL